MDKNERERLLREMNGKDVVKEKREDFDMKEILNGGNEVGLRK